MIRRRAVAVVVAAGVLAACSGGESIVEAGNERTTVPATTAAATTTAAAPGTTDAGADTTVAASTAAPTTTSPLDALPACDTTAFQSASSPVQIQFWHGLTGPLAVELVKLADAYNASQTKVKVKLAEQGGYEKTIDAYLQAGRGSRPNLVQTPEYTVQAMVDTDSLVPLEACARADEFDLGQLLPKAVNAYRTGGVSWGLPFNVSDPVLFYNKKVFAAAGLDPEKPPLSIEDVRAYSQAIVDSKAASYGLVLESGSDSGGGWFLEQWFAKAGVLYADNDNGRSAPATQVLFDGPEGVDLLTQLQSLVTDKLAVYIGDNASGQDNLLKLVDSKAPAAMTIATTAALGPVIQVIKSGQFPQFTLGDLGVGPMPGPGGEPGALVGGAALWLVDKNDPVQVSATWDFVKYLLSAQTQSTWAAATGYLPVNQGALDVDPVKSLYVSDPRFKVGYDQLLAAADAPSSNGPVLGPLREIRGVTARAIASILTGADVASTLQAAADQADALIRAYAQTHGG